MYAIKRPVADQAIIRNLQARSYDHSQVSQKIALQTKSGIRVCSIDDIIRAEGYGNYSKIFATDHSSFLVSKPLGIIATRLADYPFFRCHQSHLIHTRHIRLIRQDGFIVLDDGNQIPLARSRKKELKSWLKVITL